MDGVTWAIYLALFTVIADREKYYVYVGKAFIIQKGVLDLETINFLTTDKFSN